MNIFFVAADPYVAAGMMCDKHVVKMILETAQMLTSVYHRYGITDTTYKPTHVNHPSTVWAGDSASNYNWLVAHGNGLCSEYTRRYGKVHKTQAVLDALSNPPNGIPEIGITPMPQCMPDEYKVVGDTIAAYRKYYRGAKAYMAKWKTGNMPEWMTHAS